jgi:hypothetical protein
MQPSGVATKSTQSATRLTQWLSALAWVALIGAIGFSLIRTIGKSTDYQDLDFGAYYRGALAVSRGETPYVVDEYGPLGSYVYGPALAFLTRPLVSLDYIWACRLWTLFNWALTCGCLAMALALAGVKDRRHLLMAIWLTAIPTVSYFWSGIRVGQASILMVTLCLGWALCLRRGRSLTGGCLLAAATSLKLAPGFLIPYLLVRRDWRGLAGVGVGGLALFLVPAPWVGLDGCARLHLEWAAHCRNTQVIEQTFRPENQSLIGELTRLPWVSNGHELFSDDGLVGVTRTYPWIALGLCIGIHGTIGWRRRRSASPAEIEVRAIAILLVAMTLIHVRAWTCNFVALVLPSAMLARVIIERGRGWRLGLVGLLLLICVCALPKIGPASDWSWWRWILQGKDFWAAVIIVTLCGWCGTRRAVTAVGDEGRRALAA